MNNLFDMTGKVALVTGASSGLGRHFAFTLADAGATVAVAARRDDKIAEVASEIAAGGGQAATELIDQSDAVPVDQLSKVAVRTSALALRTQQCTYFVRHRGRVDTELVRKKNIII